MNKKNKFLKIFLSSLILCSPLLNSNNTKAMRGRKDIIDSFKSKPGDEKSNFYENLSKLINIGSENYGKIVINSTYGNGTLKVLQEMPEGESNPRSLEHV